MRQECLEYNPETDSWTEGLRMIGYRAGSATVELPNGTFWIMDDLYTDFQLTSEIYQDGQFYPGPDVPFLGHNGVPCATQVTDDLTFFGNDRGYFYSAARGTFEETNDRMPHTSYAAQCGSATLADGTRVVIVAGGDENAVDTVQIFDLSTEEWTIGAHLPYRVKDGRTVQLRDTFLIVGGIERFGGVYYDTILEFDPVSLDWVVRSETLSIPRERQFMIDVDVERFCQ